MSSGLSHDFLHQLQVSRANVSGANMPTLLETADGLSLDEIPRRARLSYRQFWSEFMFPNMPVIVRGVYSCKVFAPKALAKVEVVVKESVSRRLAASIPRSRACCTPPHPSPPPQALLISGGHGNGVLAKTRTRRTPQRRRVAGWRAGRRQA